MSNAQKLALARSLNRLGHTKVLDALQVVGKSLPCSVTAVSGSIVTVKFELDPSKMPFTLPEVTIPHAGPEYIRYPTQVGDKGVVIAIDTYLGGISGLGGGVADLSVRGNLSALIFLPVASTEWFSTPDPDAVVVYGPNGVILRDTKGDTTLVLTKDSITLTVPDGKTVTINGKTQFNGDMKVDGDVLIDGDLTVTGKSNWDTDFVVQKNLIVMENTQLKGALEVAGTSSLKGTKIDGNVVQTGDFDQTGNMAITGDSKFDGNIVQTGDLDVTGISTFDGTMDVTGEVTSGTIALTTHLHSGVNKGSDNSGAPVP